MVHTHRQRPASLQPIFRGIRTVLYGDPSYPKNLMQVPNVPIRLHYRGELKPAEDAISVAVVGSRVASQAGRKRAYRLATELGEEGVTVVSGLAKGIDGAAHQGALKVGGRTVAVLGTGLNHVYPAIHQKLFAEIIRSGAAISQFASDSATFRSPGFTGYRSGRNFLQRNHIIVGMSQVLVVVEAEERSGTAASIRIALEQGRPVGLLRSLVESRSWAERLAESGRAFVVESTEDVLRRVER